MPVARLRAKIDTSVSEEMIRSTRKVPTIASAPTTSGRPAATTLPNTSTINSSVIGKAMSSARRRSSSTCWFTCRKTSPKPPMRTVIAASSLVYRGESSRAASRTWSSSPRSEASTSAWLPSLLRSGGGLPAPQYETERVTDFSPASRVASASAAAPTSGSSTVPRFAVTSSTRSGCCFPKSRLIVSAAREDSDAGSSKPPLPKRDATPPPSTAAAMKNTTVPTSTALRWATAKRPRRVSRTGPPTECVIADKSARLHHRPTLRPWPDDVGHRTGHGVASGR